MSKLTLIATSSFGLESVVAQELTAMGYTDLKVENGKVEFTGDERDIARCNLHLRCAERVLWKAAEFTATDFEELYQGTKKVPWEKIIPLDGKMHVTGKSIKSKLFSVPDCQSIVKKAVVEAMKRKYHWLDQFPEDGPVYKIEIAFLKDMAALTIDTSGAGLHKRGYRLGRGDAPLRETLAAAIILLSRWEASRIFADPLCGSGTIPIEAALIGRNIAPGLKRKFVSEEWPSIPPKIWRELRDEASAAIKDVSLTIFASDIDKNVFRSARENAQNAGVIDNIIFQKKPLEEFSSQKKYGCIVCNPPYGERLGDRKEAEALYKVMGDVFSGLDTWSFFVLTAHPEFQQHFGKEATKNRKLYNGMIKCYLYQYFGPLPGKREKEISEFKEQED
ncbi:MAG: class I SAM-dependent RNA methyltransferase [Spirochaetes bacterium]|nr:class I SAM-dependent RNA methyltransferase [Spirochaetota bacterium]